MSKIHKPASFEICSRCGPHGRIIFSNGTKSEEVRYQDQAFVEMGLARKSGLLLGEEAPVLAGQIHSSGLPRSIPKDSPEFLTFREKAKTLNPVPGGSIRDWIESMG